MSHLTMNVLGVVVLLATLVWNRWSRESVLGKMSEREQLFWIARFAWWRLTAIVFPVMVMLLGIIAACLKPPWIGWLIMIASILLLLFSLFWEYQLLRYLRREQFGQPVVRDAGIGMVVKIVGLFIGLGLLAFGLAGERL